jgi:hypothetical protein
MIAAKPLLGVLGVLCGFLHQCRESTAEDTEDAEDKATTTNVDSLREFPYMHYCFPSNRNLIE